MSKKTSKLLKQVRQAWPDDDNHVFLLESSDLYDNTRNREILGVSKTLDTAMRSMLNYINCERFYCDEWPEFDDLDKNDIFKVSEKHIALFFCFAEFDGYTLTMESQNPDLGDDLGDDDSSDRGNGTVTLTRRALGRYEGGPQRYHLSDAEELMWHGLYTRNTLRRC
jgi:hypothetical protein